MGRELPRTLHTLSNTYQRDTGHIEWEVVVLDNGSVPAVDEDALQSVLPGVRVVQPEEILSSPARAINAAMRELRGQLLGLWIDGARMATPGIVRLAVEAWRCDPQRVVGTLAFHLGPDVQMRTMDQGYDANWEDALLASVPWQTDGYRLFDIASVAGSSVAGWFGCINETNGLFLDRRLWDDLRGLDERFASPGGGYVNLDLWERAVRQSGDQPWMILGEGTFHQVHGGVATNGTADARMLMRDEYTRIHGRKFKTPVYRPTFVGALDVDRMSKGAARPLDRLRRVHSVNGRHFRVDLPTAILANIQRGTLQTRYKGLRLAKNPFDLALYMQTIERLKPATIIEIGTSEGGSAAWFIDQCRAFGLTNTQVISIDIEQPILELAGVTFHYGDSFVPGSTFPTEAIITAPHPWLVVEDSAHQYDSTLAVLQYFDLYMEQNDMLVVEDGVVADLEGETYRSFKDGPNHALADFLNATRGRYQIAEELCDFYGPNVTYAPNAWLRRL